MSFYTHSFSFQMISMIGFLLLIITNAESNGNSMTVNSQSLLETVTKKMTDVDSKLDLLLIASENKGNSKDQRFDPKTENRICSLSSRVIEMENEIDGLKSSASLSPIKVSSGNAIALISELRSEVEDLQSSVAKEKLKTKELEQRIQHLDHTYVPEEVETEQDKVCNLGNFDIKDYGRKSLVHHLRRVNFNVFLRKPSNASSLFNNDVTFLNGVDGDFTNLYHSKKETNPWFFVDLEVPHLIWEIRLAIREVTRAGGIKIYLANDVTFDYYGKPDVKSLPLFAAQVGNSASLTMSFTYPGGMCGRYVIIVREIKQEYLLFFELQGTGYVFK